MVLETKKVHQWLSDNDRCVLLVLAFIVFFGIINTANTPFCLGLALASGLAYILWLRRVQIDETSPLLRMLSRLDTALNNDIFFFVGLFAILATANLLHYTSPPGDIVFLITFLMSYGLRRAASKFALWYDALIAVVMCVALQYDNQFLFPIVSGQAFGFLRWKTKALNEQVRALRADLQSTAGSR